MASERHACRNLFRRRWSGHQRGDPHGRNPVSWGNDGYGQVSGTLPEPSPPSLWAHAVAIRTDGTLVSWGSNAFGQVSGTPAGTFTAVAAGAARVNSVAIATGQSGSGSRRMTSTA